MAYFEKYISDNFFVDHGGDEIRDITEAMVEFLDKLRSLINEKSSIYNILKLVRCGSMEEQTRVWEMHGRLTGDSVIDEYKYSEEKFIPSLEFDYLAILSPLSDAQCFTDSHSGYMKVALNDETSAPDRKYIQVTIEQDILKTIKAITKAKCECFNDKDITEDEFNLKRGTKVCKECMGTGNLKFHEICDGKYWFSWSRKGQTEFTFITPTGIKHQQCSTIKVQLDFLPSFEVLATGHNQLTSGNNHRCFLVPRTCPNTDHNDCWRISHYLKELNEFQKTTSCHRIVYRILKFLISVLFRFDDIKSYHIKNIVLHHIDKCDSMNNIEMCLCQTIAQLECCMTEGYIDSWCIPGMQLKICRIKHMYFKRQTLFDSSVYSEMLRLTRRVIGKDELTFDINEYKVKLLNREYIELSDITGTDIFHTAKGIINSESSVEDYLLEIVKAVDRAYDYYVDEIEVESEVNEAYSPNIFS